MICRFALKFTFFFLLMKPFLPYHPKSPPLCDKGGFDQARKWVSEGNFHFLSRWTGCCRGRERVQNEGWKKVINAPFPFFHFLGRRAPLCRHTVCRQGKKFRLKSGKKIRKKTELDLGLILEMKSGREKNYFFSTNSNPTQVHFPCKGTEFLFLRHKDSPLVSTWSTVRMKRGTHLVSFCPKKIFFVQKIFPSPL